MKTTNIILIISITIFCSGCTNYLDIKPYGRTIPKTAEEFSALLHNHLNMIDEGTDALLVGNGSQITTWDAECSDDFETCLTTSVGRTLKIYVGSVIGLAGNSSYYSSLYQVIRDCNLVLGEMKEDGTKDADKVRATAYALRGVAYYQLLRIYCEVPQTGQFNNQLGMPLVTTFNMEERPIRSTMQATIEQIESDLGKSLTYQMTDDVYRFTADVVKGYQARLYFWLKQWNKVLPLVQELLAKYPLLEGDAYKNMMTTSYDLTGNQLLKSYRSISSTANTSLTAVYINIKGRPVSLRFLNNFVDNEKTTDIRYSLWVNEQRQSIKKVFCGMRSAEFKLMEAECYYHLDKTDLALRSINDFRHHRISHYLDLKIDQLPNRLESEVIQSDAEGNVLSPLMGLILRERRKEFFLEGDRFFEQKRNGCPEYWVAYEGRKYTTRKYMYTFPIPYHDVELVAGLEQNPGYVDLQSN